MANFEFTLRNLIDEVASQLNLNGSQTKVKTIIKRWINLSQQEMFGVDDFPWTWDREVVQTVIDKTAGTVSINAGATGVTGVSTAFGSSDVGSFIQFSSTDDWYKITAVASATSLTIEKAYVGTTNLSAGTYTIRKFFYTLSANADRLLSGKQAVTPIKLSHAT